LNEDRILIKKILHQKIYGAGTLTKEFSAKNLEENCAKSLLQMTERNRKLCIGADMCKAVSQLNSANQMSKFPLMKTCLLMTAN